MSRQDEAPEDWAETSAPFFRLLSAEEVEQFSPLVLDRECLTRNFLPNDGPRLVWTDDNSNFAGVFETGPLEGFVFLLDHEDVSSMPRFRTAASFQEAMAKADGLEVMPEYPRIESAPSDADDLGLAHLYRDYWRSHPQNHPAAFRFLALLPVQATNEALEALGSADMWIQAAAADLLGKRKFGQAAQRLSEVAVSGTHNGRLAALMALGNMGEDGLAYLNDLRNLLPEKFAAYFPRLD